MNVGDCCEALLCVRGQAVWLPGEIVATTRAKGRYTTPWRERYTVRTADGVEHRGIAYVAVVAAEPRPPRGRARKAAEATP